MEMGYEEVTGKDGKRLLVREFIISTVGAADGRLLADYWQIGSWAGRCARI